MEHPHRLERISELLQQETGKIISRDFDFGAVITTVSTVVITANRQQAKVYITVFPYDESRSVLEKLKRGVGSVQHQLNKKLKMRPVPRIEFLLDDSEERSRHILDLLDNTESN